MQSNPAYSPCAPEFGIKEIALSCVTSQSHFLMLLTSCWYPYVHSGGEKGCNFENPGNETGIMNEVGLSFMVQDPSEIIDLANEMSFPLK